MYFTLPAPRNVNEAARQARCFEKALSMDADYKLEADYSLQSGKYFRVTSPEGAEYIADPLTGTCSCPDFEKHAETGCCKHLLFVNMTIEREEAAQCAELEARYAEC